MDKFRFIKENKQMFPVEKMAKILNVSSSSYYKWLEEGELEYSKRDLFLKDKISNIQAECKYRKGIPNIYLDLKESGIHVGHNKVAEIMRKFSLNCRTRKLYKVVTTKVNPDAKYSPNLLNRDFSANKPNEKWVSDITYIRSNSGWLYLCVIIDLFNREVIGWKTSNTIDSSLVCDTLKLAVRRNDAGRGLILHSDRGSQYTSNKFRKLLNIMGIEQSMSRKGDPWDNAVAESFFGALKCEEVNLENYVGIKDLDLSMIEYIEVYYNRKRRHFNLGGESPIGFRQSYERNIA